MTGQVYLDEEGNIFSSIPNNADGDCLFESLAYFEVGDKTKESICKKSTELRNQLCDAYKEILYKRDETSTRKKTQKYKEKYSYAYEVINEYHDLIGEKQKNLDDLEKGILKTLFDGNVLHAKKVCNPKQWGSDMDILVLSVLLKKLIRMYRVADNNNLLDPTGFPSADLFEDNINLQPEDYFKWPTVHILFRNINNDTNKDGNHFEALVEVKTDDIVEEEHNKGVKEQLVNKNFIDNINDSIEGKDINPQVIEDINKDLLDKDRKQQEIKSVLVVNKTKFEEIQKIAETNTKKEKNTETNTNIKKETKTKKKEDTKKKKKANKTQKKSSSSLKQKKVKTAPPNKQPSTSLKEEQVKTLTPKKEPSTNLKEEEVTNILNDLLPKETTPKNNTRKKSPQTVVNVSPKEREKLAIEMTLQDNYLEKPKVIVVEPSIKKNDIVKIKYNNGDVYIGEVKNNKKHGKGKYIFANGQTYTGEYRNGKRI
jgi:hypothetical protein